jgi:predicted DNA-binding antitoxin AbrB/MazE fold protein
MLKTLRAKYTKGIIKPLRKLHLKEGKEIKVTIQDLPKVSKKKDAFEASFGSWKGTIDAEKFLDYIYTRRSLSTRSPVKLK